jgi:hypothetical protein
MPTTLVESFELLTEAEQLAPRIEAAEAAMAQLPELAEERGWIAAARQRLATAQATSHGELLDRALRLPELESLKGERGKLLQARVADELERFMASITVAGGARSPLLEVVLLNLKPPAVRKCGRAELEKFCAELERRMQSTYARRVLTTDRYAPVAEQMRALDAAIATWRAVFIADPLDEKAAAPLRDELAAAGQAVELAVRQARLLAQAALLPAAALLDAEGALTVKAKRRGKQDDSHPILETDPPDPLLPNPAERAELSALQAS